MTITRSPLIITQLYFDVVTLTADGSSGKNKERTSQGFSDFWPVPATTPGWPPVTYTNQDGNVVEATPTVPFPRPAAGSSTRSARRPGLSTSPR